MLTNDDLMEYERRFDIAWKKREIFSDLYIPAGNLIVTARQQAEMLEKMAEELILCSIALLCPKNTVDKRQHKRIAGILADYKAMKEADHADKTDV